MDPFTIGAILAAGQLAKSELIDRPQEQKMQLLDALQTSLSGASSKINPAQFRPGADSLGKAMNAFTIGSSIGQSIQEASLKNKYLDAKTKLLEKEADIVKQDVNKNVKDINKTSEKQVATPSRGPASQPNARGGMSLRSLYEPMALPEIPNEIPAYPNPMQDNSMNPGIDFQRLTPEQLEYIKQRLTL